MTDLIRGEEWRHVTAIDQADLIDCPSDEEVLREARANITRLRTTEISLRLIDDTGTPLAHTPIHIEQRQHHMVFGCCAGSTFDKIAQQPNEATRAKHFTELFNGTHAKCYWDENWHQPIEKLQGHRETGLFTAELDWAAANNLSVRGHPLVWTVDKAIPQWVQKYSYEQQLQFLEHHVRSLIACAGGRIKTWDLCNEMLWEPSLRNLAQRDWPHEESLDEMVELIGAAMRWAREEDPTACYCINDYGLETSLAWLKERHGREVTAASQRQRMVDLARALADIGCRVDAVGTQAHTGKWFPMGVVWKTFQDLRQAHSDIHVTEFWAHDGDHPQGEGLSNEQLAADKARYICDYYTVAFGTPDVTQISYWGDDAFFCADGWKTTPAYKALYDLIRNQWWTNETVQTNEQGILTVRAFYGDHSIRFMHPDGNPRSCDLSIKPGQSSDLALTIR